MYFMVIAWILISGGNFQLKELKPLPNKRNTKKCNIKTKTKEKNAVLKCTETPLE